MYDPQKRKAKYQRMKHRAVKKTEVRSTEDFVAYAQIREVWWFDDYRIRRLLQEFTLSEILDGEIRNGRFYPKEKWWHMTNRPKKQDPSLCLYENINRNNRANA